MVPHLTRDTAVREALVVPCIGRVRVAAGLEHDEPQRPHLFGGERDRHGRRGPDRLHGAPGVLGRAAHLLVVHEPFVLSFQILAWPCCVFLLHRSHSLRVA